MLKQIHRSKEDMWWTESCLRLRDFTCTKEGDFDHWHQHDLDRGNLTPEQVEYFEDKALWLCARCEDVGQRNGRKLARMAEDGKELIHQIHAQHSRPYAKKLSSASFDGLRSVINVVRGCKIVLTRNVAYKFGLANGTRGTLIGVLYGQGGVGTFPEALIGEFPDYCGPAFFRRRTEVGTHFAADCLQGRYTIDTNPIPLGCRLRAHSEQSARAYHQRGCRH